MYNNDSSRNINDGFFEIQFLEDGVYLTIQPPVGRGRKVEVSEVIEKLNSKKIKDFDNNAVTFAVQSANRSPYKIAGPQVEEKINSTASVMITPDKMKAFITISPPEGGRMLSMQEIIDLLGQHGVVYGINKTTLDSLVKYPIYNEMLVIAEGLAPENGKNGEIKFYFDINKNRKPTILEDGSVDFRALDLIENVKKGQTLCELIDPIKGKPGKTVLGTDIMALDGRSAVLPKGRNATVVNEKYLISELDGQVNYLDGKINVFSNYEVQADVDNSTGNISFVGNVSVRGNVLSGFTIEAGGNVEVLGVVEGATIIAKGDIILKRGMHGSGKGVLQSDGDVIARYIENSNVEAKKNIKAEAIMHSNVKCGEKLELTGRKGLLVGGTAKVGKEISAKVIGSHMATVTSLEVGVDPNLRERYKFLRTEIISIQDSIKKADQAITLLRKLESVGALNDEKREVLAKSVRSKLFYTNRINEYKEEFAEIDAKLQQDVQGIVKAYNFIYPGTRVAIGTCMMYVKENLQYCTLYRDGADIRVGGIDK